MFGFSALLRLCHTHYLTLTRQNNINNNNKNNNKNRQSSDADFMHWWGLGAVLNWLSIRRFGWLIFFFSSFFSVNGCACLLTAKWAEHSSAAKGLLFWVNSDLFLCGQFLSFQITCYQSCLHFVEQKWTEIALWSKTKVSQCFQKKLC